MINKKNLLGKSPYELGDKDAIHVAIVSVRAGAAIAPGAKCNLNADREAVCDEKGVGIADPFLKQTILKGESFWLLLNQDEIPNVRHQWDHPSVDFSPPVIEVKLNKYIQKYADELGVTYQQLMAAADFVMEHDEPAPYPGTKDISAIEFDSYDFWYEWSNETLYEFANHGSECCPEYSYPEVHIFEKP